MFLSRRYYKTISKTKDEEIEIISSELNDIYENYHEVLFINLLTKEFMLVSNFDLPYLEKDTDKIERFNEYTGKYTNKTITFKPNKNQDYITDIQLKILSKIHFSWYNNMIDYISSNKFINVLKELGAERKKYPVFPEVDKQFVAYQKSISSIKVIFIGLDPYTTGEATGIAFATDRKVKPVSLQKIEEGIKDDLFNYDETRNLQNNLLPLIEQGVLFMNCALTVPKGKVGGHIELWKDFTTSILKSLDAQKSPLLFVFLGKKAQEFSKHITNPKHNCFLLEHPAKASYEDRKWNHLNIFSLINTQLKYNKRKEIEWI